MKKSIYGKIRKVIQETSRYKMACERFSSQIVEGAVGVVEQKLSEEDKRYIRNHEFEALIRSESVYAQYLIYLAALEDTVIRCKELTGFPGYLEEVFLPPQMVSGHILKNKKNLEGMTWDTIRNQAEEKFLLDAGYELESELEEEINRMAEESLYCRVMVASRLEISLELAG